MEILAIINKILDVKIVQWFLLTTCAIFIATLIYKEIQYRSLQLEHALLKTTTADLSNALFIQNKAIKELEERTIEFKENYLQKQREASKIALETNNILKGIPTIGFTKDCSENLNLGLEYVRTNTKKGESSEIK